MYDPDRHVEAIFFDPKEVELVKEKYAQEEYPWFEYPGTEQGKTNNFIWLNRIIQADLTHKYSAKDHVPEQLGWGEHMICSRGYPEKLMDTRNGILWLVMGSPKTWKVN